MRIKKWDRYDSHYGEKMDQYLAGVCGCILTTLPAFLIAPLWFMFTNHYQVVDSHGDEAPVASFFICFLGGIIVWLVFGGIAYLGK